MPDISITLNRQETSMQIPCTFLQSIVIPMGVLRNTVKEYCWDPFVKSVLRDFLNTETELTILRFPAIKLFT